MTRINVGYSAISGDALPAWLAKDTGIFEKNGLDVQLVFFTGGTTAVMALVSADTPIAQLAGPAVVNSVMAGSWRVQSPRKYASPMSRYAIPSGFML